MSVKRACAGLQRGADLHLSPPQPRSLAMLSSWPIWHWRLSFRWFYLGAFPTHTFHFQVKMYTLAFGVVIDGWGMSLGVATSPIPWRGGARWASPLP